MIEDTSLRTQDIPSKLVSLNSIRLTLKVDHIDMYVWLKNNHLLSKKFRFSCLSSNEHDILNMIGDKSLKTQDISSKFVSFDCICLTLQVNHKTCIFL